MLWRTQPFLWAVTLIAVLILGLTLYLRSRPKDLKVITGAILQQNSDLAKQLPIENAQISLGDGLSDGVATSDARGFFQLNLRPRVHVGDMVTLQLRHPDYHPMDLREVALDRLYVIRMVAAREPEVSSGTPKILSDIRIRYSTRSQIAVNAGGVSKIFEVVNTGDTPCNGHEPCSPDGKWKAAIGGAPLDAGENNTFHDVRVSCIAGPCPFTRIEQDSYVQGGNQITVTARNWSDTATFLIEAEVTHTTSADSVLHSFPAIFDRTMSFSLPAFAQGTSVEASVNGEEIIFPFGPSLLLSWAVCDVKGPREGTKFYRCVLKPGYRFR